MSPGAAMRLRRLDGHVTEQKAKILDLEIRICSLIDDDERDAYRNRLLDEYRNLVRNLSEMCSLALLDIKSN